MKDGNRAESKSNESPHKLDDPDMRKSSYSRRQIFLPFLVRIPSISRFLSSLVMALLSTVRY